MIWSRSTAIAMAYVKCAECHGLGVILKWGSGRLPTNVLVNVKDRRTEEPCPCVLRNVCRAVMNHYSYCQEYAGAIGGSLRQFYEAEASGASNSAHRKNFSMPYQEFAADVELIARRTLTARDLLFFRQYYIQGIDWKAIGAKVGKTKKGGWFNHLGIIQARLGRAFSETQPYALFPIDEYISSSRPDKPLSLKARVAAA